MPDQHRLDHADQFLETIASHYGQPSRRASISLQQAFGQLQLARELLAESAGPQNTLEDHPFEHIYHVQCISTSLVVPHGDWRSLNLLANEVIDLARWVQKQTRAGKKILMHG